jgi:hypothetical protein
MNAVFCSRKSLFDGKIRFTNDVSPQLSFHGEGVAACEMKRIRNLKIKEPRNSRFASGDH